VSQYQRQSTEGMLKPTKSKPLYFIHVILCIISIALPTGFRKNWYPSASAKVITSLPKLKPQVHIMVGVNVSVSFNALTLLVGCQIQYPVKQTSMPLVPYSSHLIPKGLHLQHQKEEEQQASNPALTGKRLIKQRW